MKDWHYAFAGLIALYTGLLLRSALKNYANI
jgi:hypothetical protein